MNKKSLNLSLLAIFALFFAINSRSQVVIVNLSQPPPNQWNVADLWNLTLTNTSSESLKVYLYGTVEAQMEGVIFEGTSAVFGLTPNFSGRIDPYQLEPADVGYANAEYEEFVMRTGTLPEGTYTICVYVKDANTDEELGRDCINQPIMHPSPPQLISPPDGGTVIEELPIFLWMSPMPIPLGDMITYNLVIMEILNGQTAIEATEANPAWFEEKNIPSTSFQFPISAREFEQGATYAWQVTAVVENKNWVIGKSEVWMFIYNNNYQIRVDSLIIVGYRWDFDDDGTMALLSIDEVYDDGNYHFALYVTNVNPGDANLYITGITKTTPECKSAIITPDKIPVTIKSGEQGVMTGTINTGKTKVKNICIEIKLEDLLYPEINSVIIKECSPPVDPIPASYDFGDAPDTHFPSYAGSNGARHMWPAWETSPNKRAWLGKVPLNYTGNNPDCEPCSPPQDLIDFETNSNQNSDLFDNGIHFFSPESSYCQQCELDSIDVTFTIDPNYDRDIPLLFHAWFDFNRDGDWDDYGSCPISDPLPWGVYDEHIIWLKARQLCPVTTTPTLTVNDRAFLIDDFSTWGSFYCATYRLYFIKGMTSTSPQVNEIWTRFRLTPAIQGNALNASKYTGQVTYGEVEDYPIVCYTTPPPEYDFGDAPDELDPPYNTHYCTHKITTPCSPFPDRVPNTSTPCQWDSQEAAYHEDFTHEWLGEITTSCTNAIEADGECNGRTIDLDTPQDDGVRFNLFQYPFHECDTQMVEVMVQIAQHDPYRYNGDLTLHLHAWFDWGQDGNWDTQYECNPETMPGAGNDHVFWLTAQPVAAGASEIPVYNHDFAINPQDPYYWPDQSSNCQRYILTFLSGQPATSNAITNVLWSRFRLFYRNNPNGFTYWDKWPYGEVEDWPIVIDTTSPPLWDFGDAPDELNNPNLHYCTHLLDAPANCIYQSADRISSWPEAAFHRNFNLEWLGDISTGCSPPCSGVSADAECSGRTVNADNLDDGVTFSDFHYPFSACETQTVDVMINVADPGRYREGEDLHLHAWFDWEQNGNWDDTYVCNPNMPGAGDDHVYWLTAQPLCPDPGPVYNINNNDFTVNPFTPYHWPTQGNCQIFRLTFVSGQPATDTAIIDTLWSRFRLSYYPVANTYHGGFFTGEVEDYPIVITTQCDSADYGDAPDESDNPYFHYCTHENNPYHPPAKHDDFTEFWLGNIAGSCECTGPPADKECDGRTIDQDDFDNGVSFQDFKYDFNPCEIQSVDVLVNRANIYIDDLYLNAWFDWNRNGYWDDTYNCDEFNYEAGNDHVYWLTYEPLCSGEGEIFPIENTDFMIDLSMFPDGKNCQMFRLTFVSGEPAYSNPEFPVVTDSLWCRFRLSDASGGIANEYFGAVSKGEVEDYPMVFDSTQSDCGPFEDIRDGRIYNAVQIGTQCWMAENLNIGTRINGVDNPTTNNSLIEKYCYNDIEGSCDVYGGLYTWDEMMQYVTTVGTQGICPSGWHLASDDEWKVLEGTVDSQYGVGDPIWNNLYDRGFDAGGNLKETGITHWLSPNTGATNTSGFTGLPGGILSIPVYLTFGGLTGTVYFWTSTPLGTSGNAWARRLTYNMASVYRTAGQRDGSGLSVRCLKD